MTPISRNYRADRGSSATGEERRELFLLVFRTAVDCGSFFKKKLPARERRGHGTRREKQLGGFFLKQRDRDPYAENKVVPRE